MPQQTTGSPLCRYCLSRRWAGWSTPPRSKKSPRPTLSLTNPSQTNYFTPRISLAMHSPISSGIAVSWGRGILARAPLLRGAIIDYPCARSGRVGVWNIIGVGWGVTGSERFDLLPPRQPPPLYYFTGASASASAASALMGGPLGCAATPRRLESSPPPLSCVFPRPGPGCWRHLPQNY